MLIPGFEQFDMDETNFVIKNINTGRSMKRHLCSQGYWRVSLCTGGKSYCKTLGRWIAICFIPNPENKPEVDHINRIKTDDRIVNLRWSTRTEQNINRTPNSMFRNNTSGITGVSWCKIRRAWVATITVNYKKLHLGHFTDIKDAEACYLSKKRELGRE